MFVSLVGGWKSDDGAKVLESDLVRDVAVVIESSATNTDDGATATNPLPTDSTEPAVSSWPEQNHNQYSADQVHFESNEVVESREMKPGSARASVSSQAEGGGKCEAKEQALQSCSEGSHRTSDAPIAAVSRSGQWSL